MTNLIDLSLIAPFFGVAWWATVGGSYTGYAVGAAAVAAAIVLVYLSHAPSIILRGEQTHQPLGTNVVHRRRAHKALGRVPSPYPDAWYALCLSTEVPPGAVRDATVAGRNFVVWRPIEGGAAVVTDAYCPHLGAHLAIGGGKIVKDETTGKSCIRCPFHGWEFSAQGELRKCPGSPTVPANGAGNMKVYPSIERNSVIAIWLGSATHLSTGTPEGAAPQTSTATMACKTIAYDDDKPTTDKVSTVVAGDGAEPVPAPSREGSAREAREALKGGPVPWFDVPEWPALKRPWGTAGLSLRDKLLDMFAPTLTSSQGWRYHGHAENMVNALIFELPENGADVAHLNIVHQSFVLGLLGKVGFEHSWTGAWDGDTSGPESHMTTVLITEDMKFLGMTLPGRINVTVHQVGPSQVFLFLDTPVGPMITVQTVTPVEPLRQRVIHAMYAPWYVPRLLVKAVLFSTVVQLEKDIIIWNNKAFLTKPVLSKADKGIPQFRRWTAQFWNDKSITLDQAVRKHQAETSGCGGPGMEW